MADSVHTQIRILFRQLIEKLSMLEDRCRAAGGINNLRIGIQESIPLMDDGEEKLACDILISNLYEADFLLDQDLFSLIMDIKRLLGIPASSWPYLEEMLPSS